MFILLSAYLAWCAAEFVLRFAHTLVSSPRVKQHPAGLHPFAKLSKQLDQDIKSVLLPLGTALMAAPLLYLHLLGLDALDLPHWPAWVIYVLLIVQSVGYARWDVEIEPLPPSALVVLSLLLAYQGLLALR